MNPVKRFDQILLRGEGKIRIFVENKLMIFSRTGANRTKSCQNSLKIEIVNIFQDTNHVFEADLSLVRRK